MAHCPSIVSLLRPPLGPGRVFLGHLSSWRTIPISRARRMTIHGASRLVATRAAAATTATTNAPPLGYQLPAPEIRRIVDAPPNPALSFSPKRDKILFMKRTSLPPLSELARPELKLAGLRIDPECNCRSRMSSYVGLGMSSLSDDGLVGVERLVTGLPAGARINFVSWSPDGSHLAFVLWGIDKEDGTRSELGLWIVDVQTLEARELIGPPNYCLNTVFDSYSWLDPSTLVACVVPSARGPPPKKPLTPPSPKVLMNEEKRVVQNRTYQDLLKSKHDEDVFDYYATSELLLVSTSGDVDPLVLGEAAVYTSLDPSPDGNYLLVSTMHRPYSFSVPCGRFPKRTEVWTRSGRLVQEVADLPLAEDIPIAHDSVRQGRRSIHWRSDKPSSLYWVETQDGGDSREKVSPRDIVYSLRVDSSEAQEPEIIHKLDLRYGGSLWGNDSLALIYESWYKTRQTRTWMVAPGALGTEPRVLFDRSSEDVYSDPGSPVLRRTSFGTYVLAQVKTSDGNRNLLLDGNGATPEGKIPFLDLLNIDTGAKERIWQSQKDKYYEKVTALMSDQIDDDLDVDKLRMLISRESQTEPPQYFLWFWPDKTAVQVTNFPHPYPQLVNLQKEVIRYPRSDGVQLTATLYLPPDYEPSRDGPLPTLVWAYPREFKSKENAGQMRRSPNEFAGIGSTSPLLWLARRFAVLDGPTIPIVGEGEAEANDSYVEQLVSSAEAAVEEIIRRGVAHPDRIAVGGHSYGAFMAANLLAHAPHLFCCGIARAGAYNRTLTPFGFQSEDRTLWEAPKTYIDMSPFMLANKMQKPILLIHGEDDNNSGTLTMQSERFYDALKGHGVVCRLVLLPFESHGYVARDSVMHTLWESERWLDKFCVAATSTTGVAEKSEDSEKDASTTAAPLSSL
ncbi:probable glutamyl endopeptidase, chloroplastic [Selaginella moellendorffii]|nr:probable glutamyl endopeptidase, chloroplastic [Selaginella moellendorffii]|eukprot:XP_002992516.2 probable glutamyl endopeptidase, chloroplastic [Selaginella moellendorffii]